MKSVGSQCGVVTETMYLWRIGTVGIGCALLDRVPSTVSLYRPMRPVSPPPQVIRMIVPTRRSKCSVASGAASLLRTGPSATTRYVARHEGKRPVRQLQHSRSGHPATRYSQPHGPQGFHSWRLISLLSPSRHTRKDTCPQVALMDLVKAILGHEGVHGLGMMCCSAAGAQPAGPARELQPNACERYPGAQSAPTMLVLDRGGHG